jgi:hypothetical protein
MYHFFSFVSFVGGVAMAKFFYEDYLFLKNKKERRLKFMDLE